MKRSDWHPTDQKMGGFLCIKHRMTRELCLSGRNSEIWVNSDDPKKRYACFTSGAKKCANLSRRLLCRQNIVDGSEARFVFEEAFLPEAVKILKIPLTRPRQIRYAEKRGKSS